MRKMILAILTFVIAAPLGAQQVPSAVVPMQPCRLLDTRLPVGSPPLVANVTYQIAVRRTETELEEGACGVPEETNAVFLAATAVGATGPGYVRIWASDLLPPVFSSFTFRGGESDSSAVLARLCAPPLTECSDVDMSYGVFTNNSHLVLDLVGYTNPLP